MTRFNDGNSVHLRFVRQHSTLGEQVLATGQPMRSAYLSRSRSVVSGFYPTPFDVHLSTLMFCLTASMFYPTPFDLRLATFMFFLCMTVDVYPKYCTAVSLCISNRVIQRILGWCPCFAKRRMTSIFRRRIISSKKKSNLAGNISLHIE